MLFAPRKVKYNKSFTVYPTKKGKKTLALFPSFGFFGIKAVQNGFVTPKQLETVRRIFSRRLKGVGRFWILIYPYSQISSKPAEVRMGKGKGFTKDYFYPVKKGQILFEFSEVSSALSLSLLHKVQIKMPFNLILVSKK